MSQSPGTTILMSLASFGTYHLLGHTLTSSVVFPSIYIFESVTWLLLEVLFCTCQSPSQCLVDYNLAMFACEQFPYVMASVASASTSMRRIEAFLARTPTRGIPRISSGDTRSTSHPNVEPTAAVILAQATFQWPEREVDEENENNDAKTEEVEEKSNSGKDATEDVRLLDEGDSSPHDAESDDDASARALADAESGNHRATPVRELSMSVRSGELLAIVGAVGAGKSSLLAGLLGELELVHGTAGVVSVPSAIEGIAVAVDGEVTGPPRSGTGVAYVPQEAWIRSMKVRENILCGAPFDAVRYRRTVKACALLDDFRQLSAGDQTGMALRRPNTSHAFTPQVTALTHVFSWRRCGRKGGHVVRWAKAARQFGPGRVP